MFHANPTHATAAALPTEPTSAAQRRAARGERQMAALDRLVEIGMAIAEAAGRDAAAPAEERTLADPGLTFSRAARAVRLTIALQQRLDEDLEKQGKAEAAARRTRIGHLVERVIEAENDGQGEDYELTHAAWEQLTEYEALDEVAGRPVGAVVARICAALGLSDEVCAEVMEAWAPDDPPDPFSPRVVG